MYLTVAEEEEKEKERNFYHFILLSWPDSGIICRPGLVNEM